MLSLLVLTIKTKDRLISLNAQTQEVTQASLLLIQTDRMVNTLNCLMTEISNGITIRFGLLAMTAMVLV